jgi:hypothetical protein
MITGASLRQLRRREARSWLVGDVKLSMPPNMALFGRRARKQFGTMAEHARNYSYIRMVVVLSLFKRGNPSRWEITSEMTRRNVLLRVVSLRG